MKLVVGLGNPEIKYKDTRHNLGFKWIDSLTRQYGTSLIHNKKFFGLTGKLSINETEDFWLLKPLTYMNKSGQAVGSIVNFFDLNRGQVLVVHDDLDLPPGVVKLKKGGGAAGHNGIKDIISQLGGNDFWRIRLGIGRPEFKEDVVHYVLNKPTYQDKVLIGEAIKKSVTTLPKIILGDFEDAKGELN